MQDSDTTEYTIKECPYCGQDRKVKKRFAKTYGKELAICEDYLNGMTYRQIGQKYNIQFPYVGKILKAQGIKPRPNKSSEAWGKNAMTPPEKVPSKYE